MLMCCACCLLLALLNCGTRGNRTPYPLRTAAKSSTNEIRTLPSIQCTFQCLYLATKRPVLLIAKAQRVAEGFLISCTGWTRTSDLWVMSPASYQLLHHAILLATPMRQLLRSHGSQITTRHFPVVAAVYCGCQHCGYAGLVARFSVTNK